MPDTPEGAAMDKYMKPAPETPEAQRCRGRTIRLRLAEFYVGAIVGVAVPVWSAHRYGPSAFLVSLLVGASALWALGRYRAPVIDETERFQRPAVEFGFTKLRVCVLALGLSLGIYAFLTKADLNWWSWFGALTTGSIWALTHKRSIVAESVFVAISLGGVLGIIVGNVLTNADWKGIACLSLFYGLLCAWVLLAWVWEWRLE